MIYFHVNLVLKQVRILLREKIAFITINLVAPKSWKYMKNGFTLFHSSRKELKEYQDKQYQDLLLYAYMHTAYYRKIFDSIGLIVNGKVIKERYDDIPILTKDIIRAEGDNLISNEAKKRGAYHNTSGGSTGNPVRFIQDKEYFFHNFGDKILFGVLNDKLPGEKEIKLWGSERDILQGSIGIYAKCINWCYNRIFLNSFILTAESMEKYIEIINRVKPKQIWAYADSIYQLAKFINKNKLDVYSPSNIVSTAGVLYDEMRCEINTAFRNSNLLNQYGSREAGLIGCEIGTTKGMRIFEHSVKAEIWNEELQQISDYGEGEILITNLTNYSMPLIRYQIGDMGEISDDLTSYSGSYSVLKKLTGRINTHFKKEDGGIVHGEYITHLFYNKEWIESFRVIQHDYKEIEFQIVLAKGYQENIKDLNLMIHDMNQVIHGCHVMVTYLEEIPKLKSGKYQFVISEVV